MGQMPSRARTVLIARPDRLWTQWHRDMSMVYMRRQPIALRVGVAMSRVTGLIKFAVIGAVLGLTFFGNTYKLAEAAGPATWYVSLNGSNADGISWATAWSDLNKVNWSMVQPGDTIVIDGGTSTCSVSPYDFQSTSPNPRVTCGPPHHPLAVGPDRGTVPAP